MNLLIVDDHAINRKLLRMQLETEGHRVLEAADGVKALEILDRESVDGVVSDILMPGMDGFRLCLEIRKRKNLARLPFVLYTATFKTPQDRELARTVGADQYLTKPSTVREIIGALEHAMQTTRDRIAGGAARHDESYVLKQYNETLVRKLEEQKHKLEEQNLELQEVLKNLQIAHDRDQESERRFRAIFDHAGVGISMRPAHDRTLPWVQVNDHFCQLLGYTRDELLKLSTADITPADGQARAISDNRRLLSDNIARYSREKQIVRKDGRRIWVLLTVATLPGPDGRPEKIISTYQDITEHKEAEGKIIRLNRVYAVLSGINTLIVHVTDRQELFNGACRIAVEHGNFVMTWIGKFDPETQDVTPVAWAGEGSEELTKAKSSARDDTPRGKGAVGRAIRERRPVFNNDLAAHAFGGPRLQEILRLGFRSQITLPLYEGQTLVGTLTMYVREPDFFDEEEVRLLTELAGDISFALENISRQQKLGKLARIRAISGEINAAILRVRNRQELLDAACNIAVEQAGFPLAWIGMLDPATQDLKPAAVAGTLLEYAKVLAPSIRADIPAGQGTNGRAFREKKPVVDNDMAVDPGAGFMRGEALKRGIQAALSLPLLVEGAPVGVMGLYTKEKDYFDDEEISLLTEVAGNISFALENISRRQKLDKLSRIRAVSSEVNAAIVRIHDREALLRETCRITEKFGRFDLVWVAGIDQEKQKVQPVAWTGFSPDAAHAVSWASISAAEGALGEAILTRKPAVRNDIQAELPVGKLRQEALQKGCGATVCLPLSVDNSVVALIVLFAPGVGFFDEEELRLLTELAGNISFALDHIGKEERIVRFSRIQAVMSGINTLIVRVRDRDELFREACQIAVEHGQFKQAWIGVVDRTQMKITPVASAGVTLDFLTTIKQRLLLNKDVPFGNTLTAQAVREKKVAVSNDAQNDPKVAFREEHAKRGTRSMVALPLQVSDEVVSVLVLYSEETGFFNEEELKLLAELAGNIEFAIDHIARQERLDYLAYYDALTGLANRTLFLERVAQSIRSAASGGHKLALFLIDLDRFKNINDSLGRQAGDALLQQVAEWMTRNLGGASLLARVDADHFAVLLPEVRQDGDVVRLIEKSMGAFMEHSFGLRDAVFRIAAKVGVAVFPDDGADADTLFRNAEAALKKAKSSGDRYLFYTQKMTEAVAGKLALENQLREALDQGEFVLHYQPKVDLASGAVCGLEALIRWQKPGASLVAPGVFIPLLEETGLILGVGKWALSKALAQHREWTARGIAAPRIAINVSAIQLQQKDFSAVVTGALQAQGGNPDALELEVTESLLMQDVQESIRTLSILRALGIHIAMDDFGTGYSSLSYLARLPINSLKIDRSFITEMAKSPQDMGIVTTIIALAHSMNLKVVAEGVETEEQSQLLKLLKCDEAQGYLFSKPLPAAEIEPLLRALAAEASVAELVA